MEANIRFYKMQEENDGIERPMIFVQILSVGRFVT